jgi:hypothetical protein
MHIFQAFESLSFLLKWEHDVSVLPEKIPVNTSLRKNPLNQEYSYI